MRIILAVIITACAITILIDTPRRELAAQLDRQWQEYREHVGETTLAQCAGLISGRFSLFRNYF